MSSDIRNPSIKQKRAAREIHADAGCMGYPPPSPLATEAFRGTLPHTPPLTAGVTRMAPQLSKYWNIYG